VKGREIATPYYSELKTLKLQDLYLLELETFIFIFKIKQLPSNFINYFIQLKTNHTKNTRFSQFNNYFLIKHSNLQRSIIYQGVKLWKNIDDKLTILSSINSL